MALFKKSSEGKAGSGKAGEEKPNKVGKIAQIRQGYKAIRQLDPNVGWFMLAAALSVLLAVLLIGWLVGMTIWALMFALPLMMIAALLVLNTRANKAMYSALEGKPGAAGAALTSIQRGWYTSAEPVAADVQNRQMDFSNAAVVFRALGRPGVVLVGEGPRPRVTKLLEAERKKVSRVAPGVPVHMIVLGNGPDDVPVRKLVGKLQRMKSAITKQEMAVVHKRLKSLPGIRDAVPAGMDPNRARMSRKSLRGR